jgi:glycosyltransferase involved in cell wall biosynthesis
VTAARIQTDSEFSRREIVGAYGIPESNISVVPLGVGKPFTPLQGERRGPPAGPGAGAPYVLHVGDLQPRRDLITALNAVIEVRRRAGAGTPRLQFVCAGKDAGSGDGLRAAAAAAGMPDALALLGSVAEDHLVTLYRNAVALVYPSRYEGFGLPVLEAMACGLPVVAADAGSVPEVLGDAGILVPPGDVRSFEEAITALRDQPERRTIMSQRGVARASLFSWERTARGVLSVYRACLGLDVAGPAADATADAR